jgi:hypothetical protein
LAFLTFDLPEITHPIEGDVKIILSELSSQVKKSSLNELDTRYDGQSWCSQIQASIVLNPPSVSFDLEVSDNHDFSKLSFDIVNTFEKHWSSLTKGSIKDVNKHVPQIRQVVYEGQHYKVFHSVDEFTKELHISGRAILMTTFSIIHEQVVTVFKQISEWFGADSPQARAVTTSRLYCGSCGVKFSSTMFMLLISTYKDSPAPDHCPKCSSRDLSLMCKL